MISSGGREPASVRSGTWLELPGGTKAVNVTALVHDVQDVIFMADVFRQATDEGAHFGLCVGGLCLVRLSVVLRNHLLLAMTKSAIGHLVADPRALEEIRHLVERLLQAALASGEQGLLCLSMLLMQPRDLGTLVHLVHAQLGHPTRSQVLENEGEVQDGRGSLWEKTSKGEKVAFLEAVDAALCLLIKQGQGIHGDELKEHLLRHPPFVALDSARRRKRGFPEPEDLEQPWAEHMPLQDVVTEFAWGCVDKNSNGKLEMGEAREMLRIVLSRPLLALLLMPKVLAATHSGPSGIEELSEETLQSLAMRAIASTVLDMASGAEEVGKAFWQLLDRNSNSVVSKEEFEMMFLRALQDSILRPVVERAPEQLWKLADEALQLDHEPKRHAGDAERPQEPGDLNASEGLPLTEGSGILESESEFADTGRTRAMPAPCSMDWVLGWLRAKGRDCSS